MSCQDGTEESVVDILRSTELWESKPKDDNRLKKVIECYRSRSASLHEDRKETEGGSLTQPVQDSP